MKAYIVTTIIGTFALDDMNKVISFRSFSKDIETTVRELKVAESRMTGGEMELYGELKNRGYRHIVFGRKKEGTEEVEPNNLAENYVKEHLFDLAVKYNFVKDRFELNQFLTKVNVELTKSEIKKSIKKDIIIVQVNGAIQETDKTINVFVERLREWYGMHFPEMEKSIASHEKFVKLVEKFGGREKIDDAELRKLASNSMGIELSDADLLALQSFAAQIGSLYETRKVLEKYMDKLLNELAPNFTEIAGTDIAAKLVARAGSIEKLAKMTSNTIQLLGSEKALFRFLHSKDKTRSPKYGIIFAHPLIQGAPLDKRGKIARLLASKLSMAIKIDFFSKDNKASELKKDLEAKVKEAISSE